MRRVRPAAGRHEERTGSGKPTRHSRCPVRYRQRTVLRLLMRKLSEPWFRGFEPVFFGVSGPPPGRNAQYGAQWKAGLELALERVNAEGGIHGRPLAYVFEDSQSDPRPAVGLAQKFVNDIAHQGRRAEGRSARP